MQQAIGYIRVSTTGQVDDGVSLDAQRERVVAWCKANDYELVDVFTDAGISGKRADNRPALQDALSASSRSGAALVVYSLSRLARSTQDAISIAERLDKAGADLVSLSERIDTTTAAGKMVFRMLAVLAEFERDLVSERTTAAMAHKRSRGERIGKVPFGFDLADDGATLIPNESEQVTIGLINQLRGKGESLRAIATELTRRKIETKEGRSTWTHTAVNRIVKRAA
jgi:DNA invertase Pin-like site-specific DNA recombinase